MSKNQHKISIEFGTTGAAIEFSESGIGDGEMAHATALMILALMNNGDYDFETAIGGVIDAIENIRDGMKDQQK